MTDDLTKLPDDTIARIATPVENEAIHDQANSLRAVNHLSDAECNMFVHGAQWMRTQLWPRIRALLDERRATVQSQAAVLHSLEADTVRRIADRYVTDETDRKFLYAVADAVKPTVQASGDVTLAVHPNSDFTLFDTDDGGYELRMLGAEGNAIKLRLSKAATYNLNDATAYDDGSDCGEDTCVQDPRCDAHA